MYIEMKDGVKSYGAGENTIYALDHVNFSLEKGKLCVVLGPSGSGKSTLLNVLGGLDSLDGGKLSIDGVRVDALTKKQLTEYRKNCVGFVFQFYNLIPDLTVKENIQVVSELSKSPLPLKDVLAALEIEKYADRFPRELSGGQQQRAAIACIDVMWKLMLDYGVMLITTAISPLSYVLTAAFTAACYFGSVWLASRKVKKINMSEALKDARE